MTEPARLAAAPPLPPQPLTPEFSTDWEVDVDTVRLEGDGIFVLQRQHDDSPGSERGLIGKASLQDLILEFNLYLQAESTFIVKIHQAEAKDQLSNSYHLMCRGANAYLARHNHIFCRLTLPLEKWFRLSLSYSDGALVVRGDGAQLARVQDRALEAGHCFIGAKGGLSRIREVRLKPAAPAVCPIQVAYELLRPAGRQTAPRVSIVTTVYDRVSCLERCLHSVGALHFKDYEQIVVADSPPQPILLQIEELVSEHANAGKLALATLKARKNDWGISPATAGLALARGGYVCFLSDDNGYVPTHFDKLVRALDDDPSLGFVYSSCLYAGRKILSTSSPRRAAIDLGQPLFRRELFERLLGGTIPFHESSWDWRMIETFLRHGVRCRHLDNATFVFRLASYPHLITNPPA